VQDSIDSPEFMRPEHFILLNYLARALGTMSGSTTRPRNSMWLSPAEALKLELNQPTRVCWSRNERGQSALNDAAPDTIEIRRLRVQTHIGVPDEERADPQTLLDHRAHGSPRVSTGLADEISRTIDYHAVALEIQALAAAAAPLDRDPRRGDRGLIC
jgi:hypothetical protein